MKKMKICLVGILTLMLTLVCFVACGGVTGTYKFKSMTTTVAGMTISYEVGQEIPGVGKIDENYMTIELKSDGTVVGSSSMAGEEAGEEEEAMTWEEVDGKISFKVEGVEVMTATVDGSVMTISQEAGGATVSIVLEK